MKLKCRCGNTSFELKESSRSDTGCVICSVQCAVCGVGLGTVNYFNNTNQTDNSSLAKLINHMEKNIANSN